MKLNGVEISMANRPVTLWPGSSLTDRSDSNPLRFENITPQYVSPERAKEIAANAQERATHGPWSDQIDKVITPQEKAFFMAVWDSIPNGNSSFMTAFNAVLNNLVTDTQ